MVEPFGSLKNDFTGTNFKIRTIQACDYIHLKAHAFGMTAKAEGEEAAYI